MGMKDKVTVKLLQATSDKTELNKKALQWKKSLKAHEKVPILQTESCGVGAFISYCHNLFVLEKVI